MEGRRIQHHRGTVSWWQHGWVKWVLISSMLRHMVRWVLSNTLLRMDRTLTSGTLSVNYNTVFFISGNYAYLRLCFFAPWLPFNIAMLQDGCSLIRVNLNPAQEVSKSWGQALFWGLGVTIFTIPACIVSNCNKYDSINKSAQKLNSELVYRTVSQHAVLDTKQEVVKHSSYHIQLSCKRVW